MKKGFAVAGLLFLLVSQAFAQKPVSFLSEFIDFTMEGSYFSINGIYMFLNRTDKPVHAGILFPFALPAAMVDSIGVMNLNEGKSIAWKKRVRDILFNVSISPFDSIAIHLYYRQPLANNNTYVLTSTRTWGDPLEKAVYTLTTDKNLVIRSFSLLPDSFLTDSIHKTYYWKKVDFYPPADFDIIIAEQ